MKRATASVSAATLLWAILLGAAACAAPHASSPTAQALDAAPCFAPIAISGQLVEDALGAGAIVLASDADGQPDAVLGHLSYLRDSIDLESLSDDPVWGAAIFVRDGQAWRAFVQSAGESAVAAYDAGGGVSVVITQLQIEAPGQQFTIARSNDGWRTQACAEAAFPAALNADAWMNESLYPDALTWSADGRGTLYASGDINTASDAPELTWWRYDTADGGRTWSQAERLPAQPKLSPEAQVQPSPTLDDTAAAELVARIKAVAASAPPT